MSELQFICGPSGSGKSTYIFDRVVRCAEAAPEKNYLIVVPEQFTMATQKELVQRYPSHSIMNIDVLSFQRLAFRVFDDLGMNELSILGETGKNLVLRKVAQEKEEALTLLGARLKRMGYVSELKSLLSEFMQYQVTPDTLRSLIEQTEHGAFSYKLNDILIIYESFQNFLSGTYITAEEVLTLLIDVAEESLLLRDSTLVLDGFTGFTPIQYRLLTRIFPFVSEVLVTITADTRTDLWKKPMLTDLFYMSEKTVAALRRIAEETQTELLDPIWLNDAGKKRFLNTDSINYLEQNLFRPGAKTGGSANGQLRLVSLPDPREELLFAVSEIRRQVREEGLRYRDFAIVSGDLSTYANYTPAIFSEMHVPVFIDQNEKILFSPLVEALRGILSILSTNYRAEAVFAYLRTGLSGMGREDVDRLENYVLARGIRGDLWRKRWAILPKDGGEEALLALNALREQLVSDLAPIEEAFRAKARTAAAECRAIYDFLLAHGIEEQLLTQAERFTEAGDLKRAREYEAIYGIVIDLLDQIERLLNDTPLSAEEFLELLDAGVEAADVGLIPPGYDRVTLGDIERTRLGEIKRLYFLGVNDGVVPGGNASGGILSELEREAVNQLGIELAPSARERAFIQKFYLYMNLTKPSERLILTFSRVDSEGQKRRPSYLVSTMQRMYKDLTIEEPERASYLAETLRGMTALLLDKTEQLRNGSCGESLLSATAALREDARFRERTERLLSAAFYLREPERISRETARELYGTLLQNSATRLERYASCAFSHFVRYGLRLAPREQHEFLAPDLGNVYHGALENYGKALTERGLTWVSVTKEEQEALIDRALADAILSSQSGEFFEDPKGQFDQRRMQRILRRSVAVMSDQLRVGRFVPEAYEVGFGGAERLAATEFPLGETERMTLTGRIDRLDTFTSGDDVYVKVVDYKSGGTTYDLLGIYEGLQLQLVVYLTAATELTEKRHRGKTVRPGGIFYYHLDDPLIETTGAMTEEEIRKALLKELRPDGVLNADGAAIEGLDEAFADDAFTDSSAVVRARRKKGGEFDSYSRVLTESDFSVLTDYTRKKMTALGREILGGNAEVLPYRTKANDACAYCDYRGICGHDERSLPFTHRESAGTKEEVLTWMRQEVEQ